jgi:RimJ/RimL family protein N-acetyltransferase
VDPRNERSLALLERVGMRREAHFVESLWFKGAWADDIVYAILQREFLAGRS